MFFSSSALLCSYWHWHLPAIISMLCNPSAALHHQLDFNFSSQLGLAARNLLATPVSFVASITPLPFSRSYTNMLFNTGLSNPRWILPGNSLHCEPGRYLCPLCCIFSLVTNSERCIPTYIPTTQMLSCLWPRACLKPFENPNMYTSKILSLCLHTNVSFIWLELNISCLTWALEGFLCAYVGFGCCYSCIDAREDHCQRVTAPIHLFTEKVKLTHMNQAGFVFSLLYQQRKRESSLSDNVYFYQTDIFSMKRAR